ncbi:MAG TPA: hypothetical protein VGG99_17705 [Acetobacteraceae bacterium]|jgi:hypothetical protein
MTLKPIQGAPPGAPIPDFPSGEAGPLVLPASRRSNSPGEVVLPSLPPAVPSPATPRGPVEIRGTGNTILTFRVIPEVPAINRSSMIISIIGEPNGDYSPQTMPHFDLTTDAAKAFLRALRDRDSSVVTADNRTRLQIEFVIAEDGPAFTISKPGQEHTVRRFNLGQSYDVKEMAARLLAELGP